MKNHTWIVSTRIVSTLVAFAAFLPQTKAASLLLTAEDFAVLGASKVTSTGPTTLIGDLGIWPGTSITGFLAVDGGPGIVVGGIHINDPVAQQAQVDALSAYNTIKLEPFLPVNNLSGLVLGSGGTVLTLFPGVYHFDDSAQLTGALILDALGDPNARFDFQIGSTLTTASASSVTVIGGGDGDNVYWQVGTSATLDTGTVFLGNIIADQSITLNTGAIIDCGRALALNAAVTLDSNNITICGVPEADGLLAVTLLGSVFGAWKWSTVRRRSASRS